MTNIPDWGEHPPGYHHPAVLSDFQGGIELVNACSLAIIGVEVVTTEEMRAARNTPGFNMDASTKFVLASIVSPRS